MFFFTIFRLWAQKRNIPTLSRKKISWLKKNHILRVDMEFSWKNCLKKSTFSPTFEIWTNFFCTLFEKNPLGSVKLISMPSAKFLNKNLRFFEETIFFPSFSDIQRNFSYFLKDTFWLACQKCITDVLRRVWRKKIETITFFFL